MPDGMLAGARPGSGNFSIAITGKAAHAGRNPEDGLNAIVAAADLTLRLAAAADPEIRINPAKIDGGGPNNIVPDQAVLRVNLRPQTPEAEHRARALIDDAVASVTARPGVHIRVHGGWYRPPKPIDATAERQIGSASGRESEWKAV